MKNNDNRLHVKHFYQPNIYHVNNFLIQLLAQV